MSGPDVVSVLEAAYDGSLDTRQWLTALLEHTGPRLDRGLGVGAAIWDMSEGPRPSTLVTRAMAGGTLDALLGAAHDSDTEGQKQARTTPTFATQSERLKMLHEDGASDAIALRWLKPVGVHDILHFAPPALGSERVLFFVPTPDVCRPTSRERGLWTRVGAHIAAAQRLRTDGAPPAASGGDHAALDGSSPSTEAFLLPSGRVLDARPAAQSARAREALRDAARAVDRARTRERHDEARALELWQGLVMGRWSLVDRFDSDGRRYIVVRRNDPDVADPRALTLRERQVLAYAAMGQPLKLIAYSLGLSVSTVAIHRGRAMRKLGLRSQAEVVRLFAGLGDAATSVPLAFRADSA